MDAVERFCRELDTVLADIAFSGIKNIHPGFLRKLESLSSAAKELGMAAGASLLNEFGAALRDYRLAGESAKTGSGDKPVSLLCRLDFYSKNVRGNR
jgi:hypothetical protein